jgi:catechol 2,3-dioxygenase-like lactoylglutathione lyase family enzyme
VIRLDHTIVPAHDRVASAQFFAEIFGLRVEPDVGHFAEVRLNDQLTFAFADAKEEWGGAGFYPAHGRSHHYAFHIGDEEFDAIFARVQARKLSYGSGPFSHRDGNINHRRGGRGFYFEDPYGHLLEVMTVPEKGPA